MEPLNYTLQVIDPIQAALQQRGLRFAEEQQVRAADQQNVSLGQGQQRLDMAQEQMMYERAQAEQAHAQQQQAAQAAKEGQAAFAEFVMAPNKTAEMARGVVQKNPEMAQAVMEYWSGQNAEQQASELAFAKQFSFALNKAPDAAKAMLVDRADRAEAAGDPGKAASYRAQAEMMGMGEDGVEAVKAQTLAIMAGVMDPKDLQAHMETSGYSQGEAKPQSAAGKIEADYRAGLISEEAYRAELAALAPQGMTVESDGQGGFRMVQGAGVTGSGKPFTEAQSKDVVFVTRAKGALDALEPVASALTSRANRAAELDPTGLSRELQSDEFQIATNAGNEFLQAILRKDTGAAITEQEQALYGVTYLPRPGDSDALIAQKKEARARAVAAIEAGMSPAQMVAQERALQQGEGVDDEAIMTEAKALRAAGQPLPPELAAKVRTIMAKRKGE